MKRTLSQLYHSVANCTRSKKPKLFKPLPPRTRKYFWVNATQTRNHLLKDPLVDWLKFTRVSNQNKRDEFFSFILDRGNEFEKRVVEYINEHKLPVVSVSDKITTSSCKKTIKLMKEGVPIIHSAPFKNSKLHTKGIIDLLVRSDKLGYIVRKNPLPANLQTHRAPKLNGNYHYVVIDIKFSTLMLRADGIHLLNSDNIPAYKGQTLIYNQAIGEIQGYQSNFAYILGRRWKYTRKGITMSSYDCFDKLGVIDFDGVDSEYIIRTQQAMEWLRQLQRYGNNWTTNPPSREELYPNMCVDSGEWNNDKKEIAREIGDITEIWYCGTKHRENAFRNGITTWRDPSCNSKIMGIHGKRAPVIDAILDINRQDVDTILPKKIVTNLHSWREPVNEVFVDFETFCDVFADFDHLPTQQKTNTIFMIGVYYKNNDTWTYRNFITDSPTIEGEYCIMDQFIKFMIELNRPKMWYWHAEKSIWNTAENRQISNIFDYRLDNIVRNWDHLKWCDLAEIFREEPIVIKNCFSFGLKEVARALHSHGAILSKIESQCDSGLVASVNAWNAYQMTDPVNSDIIKDIALYNQFDVKVLWEIINYLRNNH